MLGLMHTSNLPFDGYAKTSPQQELPKLEQGRTQIDEAASLLQLCIENRALSEGKRVHACIIRSSVKPNMFLGNTLLNMYAKCESIEDANKLFARLFARNVFTWTILIGGYTRLGYGREAIHFYRQMQLQGLNPNKVTFVNVLSACASDVDTIGHGKHVHANALKIGYESDIFVGSTLIDMYAKHGSIQEARKAFDMLIHRNVVAWNTMISGFVKYQDSKQAFELFWAMEQDGIKPNKVTFVSILGACSVERGKQIHAEAFQLGFESDSFVGSTLVDMYCKSGSIENACVVFDRMPARDVVAWNAMIAGYLQDSRGKDVLNLYWQMQKEHVKPNDVTCSSVLAACCCILAFEFGKLIHALTLISGWVSIFVHNSLIDMYAKCGSIEDAQKIFHRLTVRNVVSWSAIISGYGQLGNSKEPLCLFYGMCQEDIKPNGITFVSVLNACAGIFALEEGKRIHANILQADCEPDVFIDNALVNMYVKCGCFEVAHEFFVRMSMQDMVSWNTLISGYSQHGRSKEALILFEEMHLKPDAFTFVSILLAYANLLDVAHGKHVHMQILNARCEIDIFVGNTLIDMYAKCGSMEAASQVFDSMPMWNDVTWSMMIMGYVLQGCVMEALKVFSAMQQEDMMPNELACTSLIGACSTVADLEIGNQVHAKIIDAGLESNISIGSTLIDMYAKSGNIKEARCLFDKMSMKDIVSWNTMAAGYALHGDGIEALRLFGKMQQEGLQPNDVTYVSLLSACSHARFVDKGFHYFLMMFVDYHIPSTLHHHTCMIDLLSRTGFLNEANDLISSLPFKLTAVVRLPLLAACRVHGDVDLAVHTIENILAVDPTNVSALVLIANIYAEADGEFLH